MPESKEDRTGSRDNNSTHLAKWFAAYTATNHEKHVHQQLADRSVESFLPLYSCRRQWTKRLPETVFLPLFPNYVFVHISHAERARVLGTPGVFSIVGSGPNAWELPAPEIEAIRNGLQEHKVEPYPYLAVGERARVTSGVFAGLEGVIVRKSKSLHIVLRLDQIMRSVSIEIDAGELGPLPGLTANQRTSLLFAPLCRT